MKKKNLKSLKWRFGFSIFWVVIVPIVFLLIGFLTESLGYSFLIFGLVFLAWGAFATFFNEKLYDHMVGINTWGFKKMGTSQSNNIIKSKYYKIIYRSSTFMAGLILLIIGIFLLFLQFGIDLRSLF